MQTRTPTDASHHSADRIPTTDTSQTIDSARSEWNSASSTELYGLARWGLGYFGIAENGNLNFKLNTAAGSRTIEAAEILNGLKQRGLQMPVMLRLENVVDDRIEKLNQCFANAMDAADYQNVYRGVFPIKVNQQAHIIDSIARFGKKHSHGFECGSKAELLVAMSHLESRECLIVCNGYKDTEFLDLGFQALRLGFKCFFVAETAKEIPLILERAAHWDMKPMIGVRIKLSTQVDGHWANDSGDRSLFGLSTVQLINIVDLLRDCEMLDCLQLLHFHLGSQIPNIRNIRDGVSEACRFYKDLIGEGAPMGFLDIGGGLAVDYDGTGSTAGTSRNYTVEEYCIDVVESITASLNPEDIEHPVLISESGRWTVAPMSVLLVQCSGRESFFTASNARDAAGRAARIYHLFVGYPEGDRRASLARKLQRCDLQSRRSPQSFSKRYRVAARTSTRGKYLFNDPAQDRSKSSRADSSATGVVEA